MCGKKALLALSVGIFVSNLSSVEIEEAESLHQAQQNSNQSENIGEVVIEANTTRTFSQNGKFGGSSTIGKDHIESMPSQNGGLGGLLRTNPSVQFSKNSRTSLNGGEIESDSISIHGAPFHQNNFMLGGINMNNDINPAATHHSRGGYNPNAMFPDVASNSQGVNIDPDLLEEVSVYDSMISARYGGFQGGVVDAKIKDPSKEFHGKIGVSHTQDAWTQFHIDKSQEFQFYSNQYDDYQSKFDKWKYKLIMEGYLSDDFGLLFEGSQTRSSIPVYGFNSSYVDDAQNKTYEMKRRSDNYLLKGIWHASDDLIFRPQIIYSPAYSSHYNSNSKDGRHELRSDSILGGLDIEYQTNFAKFHSNLSYKQFESSKKSDTQYFVTYFYSPTYNWGIYRDRNSTSMLSQSALGGYGDIDQEQKDINFAFDMSSNEFGLEYLKNQINLGFDLGKSKGVYDIPGYYSNFKTNATTANLGGGSCMPGDMLCSEDVIDMRWGAAASTNVHYDGYYFTRRYFTQGYAEVDVTKFDAWLEDQIKIANLTLRPGVRFESDNYMANDNISPRFSGTYDIFGDEGSQIHFGVNRYYGRDSFANALREERNAMQVMQDRNNTVYSNNWVNSNDPKPRHKFNELKTPYNDEFAIGFQQKIDNLDALIKYVKRKGKDQIKGTRIYNSNYRYCSVYRPNGTCQTWATLTNPNIDPNMETFYYTYTNNGKSESDDYSISLKTIQGYEFAGFINSFDFGASYTDVKKNHSDYQDYLDADNDKYDINTNGVPVRKDIVYYNGKVINVEDLPAGDFNEPWRLQLITATQLPRLNLGFTSLRTVWSNYFQYRFSHDSIREVEEKNYNGETLRAYEKQKFGSAFDWDAKFMFAFSAPKQNEFYMSLDIYNVLNSRVKSSMPTTVATYEPGRQFWLEVGYKW